MSTWSPQEWGGGAGGGWVVFHFTQETLGEPPRMMGSTRRTTSPPLAPEAQRFWAEQVLCLLLLFHYFSTSFYTYWLLVVFLIEDFHSQLSARGKCFGSFCQVLKIDHSGRQTPSWHYVVNVRPVYESLVIVWRAGYNVLAGISVVWSNVLTTAAQFITVTMELSARHYPQPHPTKLSDSVTNRSCSIDWLWPILN